LACDLERWAELAMLVEAARAQQPLAEDARDDDDPLAALLDQSFTEALLPLLAMPRVSVGSLDLAAVDHLRGVVADVIGSGEPGIEPIALQRIIGADASVDVVDLDALRVALAGAAGALWGTIVLEGLLFWYWIDATGASGGQVSLMAGSPGAEALSAVLEGLPREGATDAENTTRVQGGSALLASVTGRALAAAILPRWLTTPPTDGGRVRVVTVPSPDIARLPLPALCVGNRHVLDHAELVFCPSPALASHLLRTGTRSVASRWPVGVVVVDPTGDLRHSRQLADLGSVRLVGTKRRRRNHALPATRANLRKSLHGLRSAPQTFVYAGHSTELTTSKRAVLRLADGDLAAREWLMPSGRSIYPMPRRVVLLSCSSSGLGSLDWYGLATAAMAAGADTVVCSASVHADEAEPLDRLIVKAVERYQDVVVGVADTVAQWRDEHRDDPTSPESSPLVWANYVVISIESGAVDPTHVALRAGARCGPATDQYPLTEVPLPLMSG
jgi:hypothetical protein